MKNTLFYSSLVFLFVFYLFSLNLSYGVAFVLFPLSIAAMAGAIYKEVEGKKYLKVVK